jgi:3-oxoacyl-[acyl-carrier protein] reductase
MKNILVTGVSKGLGLSILKVLLEDNGICVYAISRTKTTELELLISEYRDRLKWISYDLSQSNTVLETIFKKFIGFDTPIHGFVNNAAVAYDDIVTNIEIDKLNRMFQVNVFTPIILTKYAIRHFLLHSVRGSIIHLSSISVHTGYKGLSVYAASKGSLEAFSKNTSREWGEKLIRSNCLVAGFMETEMSSTLSAQQKLRIYNRNSQKRPTSVESVANTIKFLLSEKSESINGQNIFVDSGTI